MPLRPTEIIDELVQPSDVIKTFLNAYTLCQDNWHRSFNLFQNATNELSYAAKTRELLAALRAGSPEQQIRRVIGTTGDDDVLVGAFALLTALARHIGESHSSELSRYSSPYQSSERFGHVPYWLAVDRPSPFGGAIPRPPRSINELHATLRQYHDPLLVTPGRVGEFELIRIIVDRALENFCSERLREGCFRVAVSPLSYEPKIQGESQRRQPPQPPYAFHLTSIGPQDQQLVALNDTLKLATLHSAAVLVFPELRMPPALLKATKEFLQRQTVDQTSGLLLVVAGSWHIEDNGGYYNRCVVLNHFGEELWTHDKLREYVISTENVQTSPEFFRQIGVGEGGGSEAIYRGHELQFYDSVIGRVATAICVGFFSPEVEPLLRKSAADIMLVPAMTPSITALEARAVALVHTQHAATFVANCGGVSRNAPSFYQIPTRSPNNIRRLPLGQPLLLFDLSDLDFPMELK